MKNFKIELNLSHIIAIILIIIIVFGVGISLYSKQISKKNTQIENEIKFRNALTDQIKQYQNKENEWVSEKLTLQTTLDNLSKSYENLNDLQKDLLKRLKNVEKGQTTIAAGLIDLVVIVDSLGHTGSTDVDELHNTIQFTSIGENLEYDFKIGNVKKSSEILNPTLNINQLRIPNKQEVHFYWENDRKEGYPVSFKITNTNPYINVVGMESYVIPMNKTDVSPTNWDKFKTWNKKNKNIIIGGTVGTLVGVGLILLIVK